MGFCKKAVNQGSETVDLNWHLAFAYVDQPLGSVKKNNVGMNLAQKEPEYQNASRGLMMPWTMHGGKRGPKTCVTLDGPSKECLYLLVVQSVNLKYGHLGRGDV